MAEYAPKAGLPTAIKHKRRRLLNFRCRCGKKQEGDALSRKQQHEDINGIYKSVN